MPAKYEMTIGGRQTPAADYRETRNPADGSVVGLCPVATADHLEQAVQAAELAFERWRHSTHARRKAACEAVAKVLREHSPELAALVTREQGKPLKGLGSEFELAGAAAWSAYTASMDVPDRTLEATASKRVTLTHLPLGVVASITPWNWPLLIAVWHILPAIRTGNTVVIKPSPYTPLSTLRMVELIAKVLPAGVLNVLSGNDHLGDLLTQHPTISKVVFTGSTATGRRVMTNAAATLKRLTLELGGNDPGIILPGTDPAGIAESLFWGAFINSGQTCAALKRLYVHDDMYEATCGVLASYARSVTVGNGMDSATQLGPLTTERQLQRVSELVDDARRIGARIISGGTASGGAGYFFPVTLVADAENGQRLVDEEQFGPALPIIRYTRVEDAVRWANATDYGLAASVWGTDRNRLAEVAEQLEAGTVYINKHAEVAPNIPFGGIKSSGLGVEFGIEGLQAYTTIKVVNAAT
ncbi:MAG: aldehyde dehydrogenase family protein [Steroidobacteraceae bacterium]